MNSFAKELFLIFAITASGVAYSVISGQAPAPWVEAELEAGEIHMVDAEVLDPIWIDARTENDFEIAHIKGALLLNESNWDDGIFELMGVWLQSPRPVVIYCSSESCGTSKRIAEQLRAELPSAEIYSLHGGWQP